MKQVIYIDVLFILNLFINYLLLLLGTKFLRTQEKRWRMLLGALLGAVYSVLVFFTPNIPFFTSSLVKLAVSVLLVAVSYRLKSWKSFLKAAVCFYGATFAFSGILITLWFTFRPQGMLLSNGVVYFDISSLTLIISAIIAYAAVTLISMLLKRNAPKNCVFQIRLTKDGKSLSGMALMDTGNSLTDGFTDTPVVVASYAWVASLLSEEAKPFFSAGDQINLATKLPKSCPIRLIPTNTVHGARLLPAFSPDVLELTQGKHTQKTTRVLIAVTTEPIGIGEYQALLHTTLWNQ